MQLRDGTVIPADAVVSNADVAHTYHQLLPHAARRRYSGARLRRLRYSMSLVVIYVGTDRTYRDQGLAHHTIILGERYGPLLHDIFTREALADDFSLYLHMPTLTDPRLAPPGCESFYVLSRVPHLAGTVDWARQARPYRDRIMAALEERFLPFRPGFIRLVEMAQRQGCTRGPIVPAGLSDRPVRPDAGRTKAGHAWKATLRFAASLYVAGRADRAGLVHAVEEQVRLLSASEPAWPHAAAYQTSTVGDA